ncbi:hypothetical protein CHOED_080 [Vibrio phage CHOED]|nr:hypothetical protein CHOED_080 [Vibrio phage CHOED]AHK11940.1 hypothetical protein CHOED_080 [Vibrio phage CHOED]
MIKNLLKACSFMSIILLIILGFMLMVKYGYDNIAAVHTIIDALRPYLVK